MSIDDANKALERLPSWLKEAEKRRGFALAASVFAIVEDRAWMYTIVEFLEFLRSRKGSDKEAADRAIVPWLGRPMGVPGTIRMVLWIAGAWETYVVDVERMAIVGLDPSSN